MNFGQAIEALKQGKCVERQNWDHYFFVTKQIPADIGEEIIPKMQSLPQSAKDKLLSHPNDKTIYYRHQLLLINKGNEADNYIPSVSDLFAEDWQVVE